MSDEDTREVRPVCRRPFWRPPGERRRTCPACWVKDVPADAPVER